MLDAGALVAAERGDRTMVARLRAAERSGLGLRTSGAVVAQVWRDGSGRQAVLARLLRAVDVVPVDQALGKEAGILISGAGGADAVDATVVALAKTGDRIVTGDPGDIGALVDASRRAVPVVGC